MSPKPEPSYKPTAWSPELILPKATWGMHQTVGYGPDAAQLWLLCNGMIFRQSGEHDPIHAVYPMATDRHPDGIPLVAVRLVDLTMDECREQLARAPLPVGPPLPEYDRQRKPRMGHGGHTLTDE